MALPTNSYRRDRYLRSRFREGKFLLAAEATDIQLESFEALREWILDTYGDSIAVGPAFRADQISATELVIRPGNAWDGGLPYILKSGTDSRVFEGILETGITLSDLSATTSDIGGKSLDLSGGLADGSYSVVVEAIEEVVRETGSGAIDAFLEGVNVGEGTQHKLRMTYKIHIIDTSDLTTSPTFPLSPGIDNHFVNNIIITPSVTENFLISAIDITPDVNGADRQIVLNNSAGQIPFSVDANDYIFGRLEDSDGNIFTITSISTSDAGATVQMLLDREVDINSNVPKAGLPVITNDISYKLHKRDHHVTDGTGVPLGKRYYRIADFSFAAGALTSVSDLRTVTELNSFGTDPNVRLAGGGEISWDLGITTLTHSDPFDITLPGLSAIAHVPVPPGSISFSSDGDVAYILLDRDAVSDYDLTATVVPKEDVPSNVNVYIFAERRGDRIYFPHNGSIGDGETGLLGAFGAAFNKDLSLDLITDALTENQMDEVFAETFDRQEFVDQSNTANMTFEPFSKQYRATAGGRLIDYEGLTLPSADPTDPWSNLGTQTEGIAAGILTLTDASVGDRIAYTRTESSMAPSSHVEFESRMRITASSAGNAYIALVRDGTSGKYFGLGMDTTTLNLIEGDGTILDTVAIDNTTFHIYRLVKIGDKSIQVYVDDLLDPVITFDYDDISLGSGGTTDLEWGTTIGETATVEIDRTNFKIYNSVLQSVDVFRQGNVFYNADVLPVSDPDNPWTLEDGGGGITESIINDSFLELVDGTAANRIAYHRDESSVTRHGIVELESDIEISAGPTSFEQFGIRIEDGVKDIAAYLRDDGGTLKAGLREGSSNTLRSLEQNLTFDTNYTIKVRKLRDETVELIINDELVDTVSYDIFTDTSTNNRLSFGSFSVAPQYTAIIDWTQYSLPGSTLLARTPVQEFLTIVNSDDTFPSTWISVNNGVTWFESLEGIATIIEDSSFRGANIIARIGLSENNSVLTDYGILYNRSIFTDIQTLEVERIVYQKQVSLLDPIPVSASYVEVSGSGTRSILDGEFSGQQLILSGEAGGGTAVTIADADLNIELAGGADFTINEFDVLQLIWNGSVWLEISRSNN